MNSMDQIMGSRNPGKLSAEQLISAAHQLGPQERRKVARALLKMELDVELSELIAELYGRPPIEEIADSDIIAEVRAVRGRET